MSTLRFAPALGKVPLGTMEPGPGLVPWDLRSTWQLGLGSRLCWGKKTLQSHSLSLSLSPASLLDLPSFSALKFSLLLLMHDGDHLPTTLVTG